ncbi:hypothetical protein PCC8801_3196 [Rippkaea orientalis PCC 8801]|uniref:Uncharacterized protein n=1 Tax=Rippkaea orientalis (strain PCC 8801 / RF-1) TaxID=41431 RepID=B7JY73_RIPO1|nr:hypothetical protein [Rippkaea orientalis]ACK67175.1 hypothetical protein PCC8801_3196 [Rippkaea orientalis PCC 8801]
MAIDGFKNHWTQTVYLWLTQEETIYDQMQVLATDADHQVSTLAKEIKDLVTDFKNPLAGHNSLHAELLQLVFKEVDWSEIADSFLKDG